MPGCWMSKGDSPRMEHGRPWQPRTESTPRTPARAASEILDRLPPQNLEAERGVLGSLLLDPQMCDEAALELHADDFYADANQKLYTHILALHDEGKRIDTTLLVEHCARPASWRRSAGPPTWPRSSSRFPMRPTSCTTRRSSARRRSCGP